MKIFQAACCGDRYIVIRLEGGTDFCLQLFKDDGISK